ncbi:Glycerol-3-phosphate 2-O-acyltransferase 6 [Abeliophyllum distichum]|uniref:Glycerol-3-phosphate acyltransferase RAM2 n=1 Tax=Abeliophyllum distichum TaxID=126358 RepID=A0ABD1Q260_9LAMI
MAKTYSPIDNFPTIDKCKSEGRGNHTSVVTDLDGTLLVGRDSFPYFALVAFDVGGILRLFFLLLFTPFIGILYHFGSESAAIRLMIFATFVGVKVDDIKSAAAAVLPKHYSSDLHPETWSVFSSCGKRCVLTENPRIMVEPFLKNYLEVDLVLGTEISTCKGRATGFVASPGVLVGKNKANALRKSFDKASMPDIAIGDRKSDFEFMKLCKERYIVPSKAGIRPVSQDQLPKPVIFHDGRLVQKPTPLMAFLIILWIPISIPLAILRVASGSLCPIYLSYYVIKLLNSPIIIKGTPPIKAKNSSSKQKGVLFVCSHRTVADAVYLSMALGRPVASPSYSVSRLTEIISPIKSARLSRNREKDAKLIKKFLEEGDLIVCAEGTTCREPYLLRFSALFAELTDQLVPVAISIRTSLFHGTTARGYKWMDPFFFAMNPRPVYEITFLNKLSHDQTCAAGKSSQEVANNVQQMIASALSYKCTKFTRRDKYLALAGTDGTV